MIQQRLLVLNPDDNVAVALTALSAGETVAVGGSPLRTAVAVQMAIPSGHKIALRELKAGETVVKYGQPIGTVTQTIRAGEHVHIHNVVSARAG
jgi:altronate dehydratase